MFKWMNSRIKRLNWLDMGLIKLGVAGFVLMLAKLWLPLLALQWYWYLIIMVLAMIRPLYKVLKE
jgi:hypothetical protein